LREENGESKKKERVRNIQSRRDIESKRKRERKYVSVCLRERER
jgi:hypothetical protein